MVTLYKYQVLFDILDLWENRCSAEDLRAFLKEKSVDELEAILEFSDNTANSKCQLEEMIVWFYKLNTTQESSELLDYSVCKEQK